MTEVTYIGDNPNNLIALAKKIDKDHNQAGALSAFCKGVKGHPNLLGVTAINETTKTIHLVSGLPEVSSVVFDVHLVAYTHEIYTNDVSFETFKEENILISYTVINGLNDIDPRTDKKYSHIIDGVKANESPYISTIFDIGKSILLLLEEESPWYAYHSHVYEKGKKFILRLTNKTTVIDIKFSIDTIYNSSLF